MIRRARSPDLAEVCYRTLRRARIAGTESSNSSMETSRRFKTAVMRCHERQEFLLALTPANVRQLTRTASTSPLLTIRLSSRESPEYRVPVYPPAMLVRVIVDVAQHPIRLSAGAHFAHRDKSRGTSTIDDEAFAELAAASHELADEPERRSRYAQQEKQQCAVNHENGPRTAAVEQQHAELQR